MKTSQTILGLAGLCLMGLAVGTYVAGITTGLCLAAFILGAGLLCDAVRK